MIRFLEICLLLALYDFTNSTLASPIFKKKNQTTRVARSYNSYHTPQSQNYVYRKQNGAVLYGKEVESDEHYFGFNQRPEEAFTNIYPVFDSHKLSSINEGNRAASFQNFVSGTHLNYGSNEDFHDPVTSSYIPNRTNHNGSGKVSSHRNYPLYKYNESFAYSYNPETNTYYFYIIPSPKRHQQIHESFNNYPKYKKWNYGQQHFSVFPYYQDPFQSTPYRKDVNDAFTHSFEPEDGLVRTTTDITTSTTLGFIGPLLPERFKSKKETPSAPTTTAPATIITTTNGLETTTQTLEEEDGDDDEEEEEVRSGDGGLKSILDIIPTTTPAISTTLMAITFTTLTNDPLETTTLDTFNKNIESSSQFTEEITKFPEDLLDVTTESSIESLGNNFSTEMDFIITPPSTVSTTLDVSTTIIPKTTTMKSKAKKIKKSKPSKTKMPIIILKTNEKNKKEKKSTKTKGLRSQRKKKEFVTQEPKIDTTEVTLPITESTISPTSIFTSTTPKFSDDEKNISSTTPTINQEFSSVTADYVILEADEGTTATTLPEKNRFTTTLSAIVSSFDLIHKSPTTVEADNESTTSKLQPESTTVVVQETTEGNISSSTSTESIISTTESVKTTMQPKVAIKKEKSSRKPKSSHEKSNKNENKKTTITTATHLTTVSKIENDETTTILPHKKDSFEPTTTTVSHKKEKETKHKNETTTSTHKSKKKGKANKESLNENDSVGKIPFKPTTTTVSLKKHNNETTTSTHQPPKHKSKEKGRHNKKSSEVKKMTTLATTTQMPTKDKLTTTIESITTTTNESTTTKSSKIKKPSNKKSKNSKSSSKGQTKMKQQPTTISPPSTESSMEELEEKNDKALANTTSETTENSNIETSTFSKDIRERFIMNFFSNETEL